MIYHHHARQGLALSRTLLRSFDDFPFTVGDRDRVMIRPAADENATRELETGDRCRPKQAVIRRRWTGFVCEVKSLQWQRLQG